MADVSPTLGAASWNVQTVDEFTWGGGNCPIVVDKDNVVHIAFMAFPSGTNLLMYASFNGSGWKMETVTQGKVYSVYSLVLDQNNYPHILYDTDVPGASKNGLALADWNGQEWTILQTGLVYSNHAALHLDSDGNPCIAFTSGSTMKYGVDWVNNKLNFARWTGQSWIVQTVADLGEYSVATMSIQCYHTANQPETPYILYNLNRNLSDVRLAVNVDSAWQTQNIPVPSSTNDISDLVLDSGGKPHFVCTMPFLNTSVLNSVYYFSFDGSCWNASTVAKHLNLDMYDPLGSILLDPQDLPHMVLLNSVNEPIYLTLSNGEWKYQNISAQITHFGTGDVEHAQLCYLALDQNGDPHISYREASLRYTTTLMYASPVGSSSNHPLLDSFLYVKIVATTVLFAVALAIVLIWGRKNRGKVTSALPFTH